MNTTKTKIRAAVITTGAAAAIAGLAGLGVGTAAAEPVPSGCYTMTGYLPALPTQPQTPSVPAGTALIGDGSITVNGLSGLLKETPGNPYADAVTHIPRLGKVVLLDDSLIIGPNADREPGGLRLALAPCR